MLVFLVYNEILVGNYRDFVINLGQEDYKLTKNSDFYSNICNNWGLAAFVRLRVTS